MFGFGKPAVNLAQIKQDIARVKTWVAEVVDTTGAVMMVTEHRCEHRGCRFPFSTEMALLREGATEKKVLPCAVKDVTREEVVRIWSLPGSPSGVRDLVSYLELPSVHSQLL